MKKFLILLICIPTLGSAQIEYKTSIPPRSILKIAPFQFVTRTLELGLESLNHSGTSSLEISGGYRSGASEFRDAYASILTVAFRKYVQPLADEENNAHIIQGIYFSLLLKGEYFEGTMIDQPTHSRIISYSPGFSMGLQCRFFEFVYADFYFGGGIRTARIREKHNYPPGTLIGRQYNEYDLFDPAYEGIYPIIGVKLGVPL